MAIHANSRQRQFTESYPTLFDNIQVKMIEYVKSLLEGSASLPGNGNDPAGGVVGAAGNRPAGRVKPVTQFESSEGFPIMPKLLDDDEKLKKGELEDVMRQYLNIQYSEFAPKILRAAGVWVLINTQN